MEITGHRWSEVLLLPLQMLAYSPGLALFFSAGNPPSRDTGKACVDCTLLRKLPP